MSSVKAGSLPATYEASVSAASLALLTMSAVSASRTLILSPGTRSTPTVWGSGMSGTVA